MPISLGFRDTKEKQIAFNLFENGNPTKNKYAKYSVTPPAMTLMNWAIRIWIGKELNGKILRIDAAVKWYNLGWKHSLQSSYTGIRFSLIIILITSKWSSFDCELMAPSRNRKSIANTNIRISNEFSLSTNGMVMNLDRFLSKFINKNDF